MDAEANRIIIETVVATAIAFGCGVIGGIIVGYIIGRDCELPSFKRIIRHK